MQPSNDIQYVKQAQWPATGHATAQVLLLCSTFQINLPTAELVQAENCSVLRDREMCDSAASAYMAKDLVSSQLDMVGRSSNSTSSSCSASKAAAAHAGG